ncbi:hydrogenase maturation protease [Bacillus sp. T33-2]|uniref:hydrogenase maturation protease n=1 Tax=Bacillus sp. T33-2 TaxID=2054168 RepID=UPI000C78D357|nr:hydrogenase maturation protease [Bacillus sp. T33-2]PLR95064.1 hydrogenase maturation protease [Bacillus sp. T33-2]
MEKIMVLGIGNQLMMDDGIGIYLVEELKKRECTSNISYLVGESDIDYCIEQIEGASFVIILDAVISGKEPGDISNYPLANLHQHERLDISPHNLHLFHVLANEKDKIKGFLIGVEPYEIRFHIGLSQTLHQKWDLLIDNVKVAIKNIITKKKED